MKCNPPSLSLARRSRLDRRHGTLIERDRLDQCEHAVATAKLELIDGLTRRECEEMTVPIEVDRDAGERPVIGFDVGHRPGKNGPDAEVRRWTLRQRDVGGLDDDACLAADGPGPPGKPDRPGGVRNLGEAIGGVDRGKPAGDHRRLGEAQACR
jgi:hypothetical protein